tara:strand:- start:1917 stop:2198 length:282 start_codon:yes stop_codon:yes gene_type:complete
LISRALAEYICKRQHLEVCKETNWEDFGNISAYFQYKWDDKKERWHSYNCHSLDVIATVLLATEEETKDLRDFIHSIMSLDLPLKDWIMEIRG